MSIRTFCSLARRTLAINIIAASSAICADVFLNIWVTSHHAFVVNGMVNQIWRKKFITVTDLSVFNWRPEVLTGRLLVIWHIRKAYMLMYTYMLGLYISVYLCQSNRQQILKVKRIWQFYFFWETNNKPICLIWFQQVAVPKELNMSRHYETSYGATDKPGKQANYSFLKASNSLFSVIDVRNDAAVNPNLNKRL